MNKPRIALLTAQAFLAGCKTHAEEKNKATTEVDGQYAEANGLKMYYELHGAFGCASAYPALAKNRQQIAVEFQGHGHMADDIASRGEYRPRHPISAPSPPISIWLPSPVLPR